MSMKIRKQDRVKVIAGKSKGSEGIVLEVMPRQRKLVVQGVNKTIKHEKPNPRNEQGGRVEKELPIHVSNVMLVSPKSGQPVKVSRREVNGRRVRVEKKSGNTID